MSAEDTTPATVPDERIVRLCPTCLHDGVLEQTLERAEAAEGKLAAVKEYFRVLSSRDAGFVMSIIGAEEERD